MSLSLNPLYHWSPKVNRAAILSDGLKVLQRSRLGGDPGCDAAFPWVCCATTPSSAWGLILDPELDGADGESGWDLWQVHVAESDTLRIRGDFSPYVREVRIMNGVPPDRVWWVAERLEHAHESMP